MTERGTPDHSSWSLTWTLRDVLTADLRANGMTRWRFDSPWRKPTVRYLRLLRRVEWLQARRGPVHRSMRFLLRFRLQQVGLRTGLSIPPGTCGPGLGLPHYGTIVVNKRARIGPQARINQGVTVGVARGGTPVVGSHVFLGPNATVLGAVSVGDRAVIAANSVVLKDVPSGVTAAGIPARVISSNDSSSLLPGDGA